MLILEVICTVTTRSTTGLVVGSKRYVALERSELKIFGWQQRASTFPLTKASKLNIPMGASKVNIAPEFY
jgi:hypothetical protein